MTLRKLREKAGLSQVELAVAVGVSPATIYRLEAGRNQPTDATYTALCEFFGVKVFTV